MAQSTAFGAHVKEAMDSWLNPFNCGRPSAKVWLDHVLPPSYHSLMHVKGVSEPPLCFHLHRPTDCVLFIFFIGAPLLLMNRPAVSCFDWRPSASETCDPLAPPLQNKIRCYKPQSFKATLQTCLLTEGSLTAAWAASRTSGGGGLCAAPVRGQWSGTEACVQHEHACGQVMREWSGTEACVQDQYVVT
eukprot:1158542-Pelagomonas_calceolata.AAC.3